MNEIQEIKDFYKIKDKLIDMVYESLPANKTERDELRAIFNELQKYRETYILKNTF